MANTDQFDPFVPSNSLPTTLGTDGRGGIEDILTMVEDMRGVDARIGNSAELDKLTQGSRAAIQAVSA